MPTTYFVRIIIIIKNPYVFFKGFAKIKTSKAFWQSQGQRRSFQNSIDKIFSNIKEKTVSFRWLRKEATRNKRDDISSFSFSYMIVFSMNLGWIRRSKFFRRSQTLASNLSYFIYFLSLIASGIQLKESRIPLTIEIQNPSSTDRDIQYLETWIPLHQAILTGLPQHCTATRSSQKKITPSSILSEGRWRLCPWPLPDIKGTNHSVPIMLVFLLCGGPYYVGVPIMPGSLLCWCAYYAGVPIMWGSLLCRDPYYAGVPIMRGSLLCACPYYAGVPIMRGSLLCGCAYYAGVRIMRGSLLCGCPYYAGVPIMRGSLLCGCAYYAGVRIMRGSLIMRVSLLCGVLTIRVSLLCGVTIMPVSLLCGGPY